MSAQTPNHYRCPACGTSGPSGARACPRCGLAREQDDRTWIVEAGTTPPPGSPAGQGQFHDRYELLEEVGRGGMGIVHKAIDRELDETIALKVLAPAAGANPDLVVRFKHEVKVARRLTHPCIARLHDLVAIRGQLCLSMEYIEGRSLREVIAEGPMSPARVVRMLRQLGPALDLAHAMGIVHRDLKPGNVIVDARDVPHILDFGIAKSQWLQQREENLVGTPAYMAPEQWVEGADVDGRADLYSLGVMAYEMLCARRPFDHRNRLILMEMHRSTPPAPPSSIVPGLPRLLEAAVLRLLEKDPARRFPRAADLLEALEERPAQSDRRTTRTTASRSRPPGAVPPVSMEHGKRGKVLVADDDPLVRRILGKRMRDRDLVVVEAADGGQAIERALLESPDLILLDVRMPVLDGLEALRFVKNDPRMRDVPVVMMSGLGQDDVVAFSKENGAASFLEKPISEDVMDILLERYFQ